MPCRYWAGKGLWTKALSGALNLAALAFTIGFSGFLMLGVDWKAVLTAPCITEVRCMLLGGLHALASQQCPLLAGWQDTCDIMSVALVKHPLASRGVVLDVVLLAYLTIFGCGPRMACAAAGALMHSDHMHLVVRSAYWAWSAIHYATDLRDMLEVRVAAAAGAQQHAHGLPEPCCCRSGTLQLTSWA